MRKIYTLRCKHCHGNKNVVLDIIIDGLDAKCSVVDAMYFNIFYDEVTRVNMIMKLIREHIESTKGNYNIEDIVKIVESNNCDSFQWAVELEEKAKMLNLCKDLNYIDTNESMDSLVGKVITSIETDNNTFILFKLANNENYLMYHESDCCEDVHIEEIHGDLNNLIGYELTMSECTEDMECKEEYGHDSMTLTFYKLACLNGYVTIRWFGGSNGYYSERVNIAKVEMVGL